MEGSARDRATLSKSNQDRVMMRITWRLLPLLFFCYIIAYVDRINVGFAKLQLREVLGVDPAIFGTVYGIGAGLFFLGYFLFEIPSNLVLQRVGARIWITRIMIVWGFVTIGTMFIKSTASFYFIRFLLGAAEAGFFPGVILYLTYWFPARERGRAVAMFATGGVVAGVIGSPLSGAILNLDGKMGLDGWQWLFLIEGIPAVLMGLVVLLFLPGKPQQAKWLSSDEKSWLQETISNETALSEKTSHTRFVDALKSSKVWLLCLLYFLLNIGGYGFEMWSPTIIKGFSNMNFTAVGFINAIPYFVAVIVMLITGSHSDRTGERRWYVSIGAVASAIGFALSAYLKNPFLAMAALTLAFAGLKTTVGPFWAFATTFLSGTAAAGGIALINSVGNLGGFVGPTIVGVVTDRTGNPTSSLWILGGALLLMGSLILFLRKHAQK